MAASVGDHGITVRPAAEILPGLFVAAAASLGAGAVHATAAGVHAEHPALARIFVICAAAQILVGVLAAVRPSRLAAAGIVAVNVAAVAGWTLTRIVGIGWVDGLRQRESPQFADTACAALGAVAAGAALVALLIGWQRRQGRPSRSGATFSALAVVALTMPAMLAGGTHAHSHTATSATSATSAVAGHDHGASSSAAGVPASTVDESQPHQHDSAVAVTDPATGATTWPRPWDPAIPIDVSGVPGVTPEEQARATTLIEGTLAVLPKWADPAAAVADGYASIGDAATGSEHYIKTSLIEDGDMLDPAAPESLVYTVDGDLRTLAGAMYIASARPLDDPSLSGYAGPLMTWHEHNNLCWGIGADGKPKVVGLTNDDGSCTNGVAAGGNNPMVHVWIVPRECGVFSALEGVGQGSAAVAADQRTDTCATTHDHSAHTAGTAGAPTAPSAAVPSLAYDPNKPIDLGGVPGVTPEQQAAAENLVAINVVRLPQWADYHVAEAAGFHSIGDAVTGHEHFINWAWINDKVWLDPDHPESLVYEPQPDGSKKLVSAMYMLPDTVKLPDVPDIGGALMQWHIHDNLCFTTDLTAPQVAGITATDGTCPSGLVKLPPAPMIHVWIVPNACGPFAALDGIGAGQIAAGQTRLCDHVHGDGLL